MTLTYRSAAAFKQALEQRLSTASASGTDFARRRQLLVFDRFLARVALEFGDAVTLKGGLAVELRIARARTTKDVDLRVMGSPEGIVYPHRINPLTTGPGLPRFIDGSRTLKGDGNFPFVAERRGVSFIERSLHQGLQFARHRNNTEALRAQVRRTIVAFLLQQMNQGAFRSNDPQKAFFVDVSDTLNPPSVVMAGQLIIRVGLATNKPAEFIILRIAADNRAFDAELAAASN